MVGVVVVVVISLVGGVDLGHVWMVVVMVVVVMLMVVSGGGGGDRGGRDGAAKRKREKGNREAFRRYLTGSNIHALVRVECKA